MDTLEILQRRDDALKRVRSAWQDIIKRYSSVKMQDEGDIVDLQTGEIVNDNGHLRSLTEKADSIWAHEKNQTKKNQTKTISSSKKLPNNINISKPIEIIELDKQPSITNSKHLTRSKVAGDDNLILQYRSKHNQTNNKTTFLPRSGILQNNNSNLSNDPMNLLKSLPSLDTPSKVRRLRKAMDKHVKYRPIHSLILRTSRNTASSILKSKSGSNKSKIK
ncbi:hypothetical protein CANINC_004454 [Pichia inconspicua]|uniref:Uncharacterized protein n=1 Tax=Pichia inconspicua TaxID=52247 RepID=A0A4T0WVB5_9ASCO|nr:hypothetical protein CANINC_004454 [[Candida] inconspicua]